LFNNLINIHDFERLYDQLAEVGFPAMIKKLAGGKRRRVEHAWQHTETVPRNWWDVPEVLERWNRLIAGNRNVDSYAYVSRKYLKGGRSRAGISYGCGAGAREIEWARTRKFKSIDAFDLSRQRILEARERAGIQGLTNILNFQTADVFDIVVKDDTYDVAIAEGILHHLTPLKEMLSRVRRMLKNGGLFVVNEYVGPSRFQWTDCQLALVNGILASMPDGLKTRWGNGRLKKEVHRPGRLSMILNDPSEAVESPFILQYLREMFDIEEEKAYGGTILHLLLKDIAHHFTSDDRTANRFLRFAFELEDLVLKNGVMTSDFIFVVCRNRK